MSHRAVTNDQDLIRSSFPEWSEVHETMTSPDVFKVAIDIIFDWLSITAAMLTLHRFGLWSAPAAVVLIGNRQRALGNLLHDAAHRNLAYSNIVNDTLAHLFVAPALFNSLTLYRERHARHHAWLGDPMRDPDYISVQHYPGDRWWRLFLRVLLTPAAWLGSTLGHLQRVGRLQGLGIVGWWATILSGVTLAWGIHTTALFFGIWMLAKMTVFHAITTFRELCDHFGLRPGGIFHYTRDISSHSPWRWIIHPHNNGYHLTHHLMPSIPYHRLARAQRTLLALPAFTAAARVSHAYFRGPDAVVHEWVTSSGTGNDAA